MQEILEIKSLLDIYNQLKNSFGVELLDNEVFGFDGGEIIFFSACYTYSCLCSLILKI